jgi:leucyl-tRNA synthetase/predicted alpha/beta hydrolase family esterase
MNEYDFKSIEAKWQKVWDETKPNKAIDLDKRPKKYILDMFPYPSSAGLHVGHPEGYTATDIYSRYSRMNGVNVLHPMGWDAFGLPAENYAIKTGTHPKITTEKNIAIFKTQLKKLGLSYDWDREIDTTDPDYYKWTQWIFLKLLERGLAYESTAPINFCPSCKTGLANEEVENGLCERCKSPVERKSIRQWILRITKYADRLLSDLDNLDWPESIKEMQRNWIGRSEGAKVKFLIKHSDSFVEIYTTRVDTIFSGTYIILAPEHGLIAKLQDRITNLNDVEKYIAQIKSKSDLERTDLAKDKTGVELKGIVAINPANGQEMPVWISDFVLLNYGTGAVFADAHDERDFEMAKKYNIPLRVSIRPQDDVEWEKVQKLESCFEGDGILVNSDQFDGLTSSEARIKITDWLSKMKLGEQAVSYKLRDWIFSRQRYWGEPIPVVHCENCAKELKLTFLLIHGIGGSSKENWFPWFKEELERMGHTVIIPDLPNTGHPNPDEWQKALSDIKNQLTDNTVIIAHSLGAPVACKFIERENLKVKKLILVAPTGNTQNRDELKKAGFSQQIIDDIFLFNEVPVDLKKVKELSKHRHIYLSDNDPYIPLEVADSYKDLETTVRHFSKKGHFNKSAGVIEFPELFDDIKPLPVGIVPIPEKDLPVTLPEVKEYEPSGTGDSPLANIRDWVNTTCPKCGGPATRETNTMPQWAGSCWYYIAFALNQDLKLGNETGNLFLDNRKVSDYWLPVDLYVGGAEHAVLHLLYARFWHKFLFDIGAVSTSEPFMKLKNQGMILAEDGRKMSKSLGNVINPDDIVNEYGADTLRLYEMFMGPFEMVKKWDSSSIGGVNRFLKKVFRLVESGKFGGQTNEILLNQTIKKVTEDIEGFRFNTAISALMIMSNDLEKRPFSQQEIETLVTLLSPLAPHLGEELWQSLGHKDSVFSGNWPTFDQSKTLESHVEIVIQINSKIKAKIQMPLDSKTDDIKDKALENPRLAELLAGKTILKTVIIKNRLINFVI